MRYLPIVGIVFVLSIPIILNIARQTKAKYGHCNWCHAILRVVAPIIGVLAAFGQAIKAGFIDANEMSNVQADDPKP